APEQRASPDSRSGATPSRPASASSASCAMAVTVRETRWQPGRTVCEGGRMQPEGVEIRDVRPEDADAVRRVVAAAFGDGRGEPRTEAGTLWAGVAAPGHVRASLVAGADGEAVGHV